MKRKKIVSGDLVRLQDLENNVEIAGYRFSGYPSPNESYDWSPAVTISVHDIGLVVCLKSYKDPWGSAQMIDEFLLIVNGSTGWFDSSEFCVIR